jgi:hypothetical protein
MSGQFRSFAVSSFAAAAIATALAMPAAAEEFSWQLSGGTSRVELGDFDFDSGSVDATYFVNAIDDSAGPYALASFLNPTTRFSAEASERDSVSDAVGNPAAYTLGGTYVLPAERWYVGASYARTNEDYTSSFYSQSDQKGYGAVAGWYLGPSTTLELGFGRSDREFEMRLSCPIDVPACTPVPLSAETTTDSVGLEVFHLRRFRSMTYSLQGGVTESDAEVDLGLVAPPPPGVLLPSDSDALRVYSVAGELYPTDRFSVRIGYARPDGGSFGSDSYDLAATWFFKPRIAVQFAVGQSKIDDVPAQFGKSDSAAVRLIGRL